MNIPPDIISALDQQCARTAEVLDELVKHQREYVADQGPDNSTFVASLSAMLLSELCPGHLSDLLALAARRLAAK